MKLSIFDHILYTRIVSDDSFLQKLSRSVALYTKSENGEKYDKMPFVSIKLVHLKIFYLNLSSTISITICV